MQATKVEFGSIKTGDRFKHGQSIYVKCGCPFDVNQMGGIRAKGKAVTWKAFEDKQLVSPVINI